MQIKHGDLGHIRSTTLPRPASTFWHLPYCKNQTASSWRRPLYSKSPKTIWMREERCDLDCKKKPESICLPLPSSACVFHLATDILRRWTAPLTEPHTHDVIEVLSLQAADDVVLDCMGSHACFLFFCAFDFRSNKVSSCHIACMKEKSRGWNLERTIQSQDKTSWQPLVLQSVFSICLKDIWRQTTSCS